MHRIHGGLTVAVPVADGRANELSLVLKRFNVKDSQCQLNFSKAKTALFVSGVVLPEEDYKNRKLPETLVFSTSYVGPLDNHLTDIVESCGSELCEIFRRCEHFPEGELVSCDNIKKYLRKYNHRSAFNSRCNYITREDMRLEKELRSEIENYLDSAQQLIPLNDLKAREVRTLIQRHIKSRGDVYEWALSPAKLKPLEFIHSNRVKIVALAALAVVFVLTLRSLFFLGLLAGLALAGALIAVLVVAKITSDPQPTATRPPDAEVRKMGATQLHPVLNEMTAAGPLKPGRLRRHFYAASLRFVNFISSFAMDVPTVVTIRWLVINKKRRLLFLPVYSNTTDFYVHDFLNGKTPHGVNFMFTHGKGFPDARWLRWGGISDDPTGYMNAVHTGQKATEFWYAHNPSITVDMINKNRTIRNGLFGEMLEQEAKDWLKLL